MSALYDLSNLPRNDRGEYIIRLRDDIWTVVGNYPNEGGKTYHLCTSCIGHLKLNHKLKLWEMPDVKRYYDCCQRCGAMPRPALEHYLGISYQEACDIIQHSGGKFIRDNGAVIRLYDNLLSMP